MNDETMVITEVTRANWIAIRLMKLQDGESPEPCGDVDFEATYDADWTKDGYLEYPEKTLAKRSLLLLHRKTGLSWDGAFQWLAKASGRVRWAGPAAALLGAILHLTSWRLLLNLSDTGRVPVFHFAIWMAVAAFLFFVTLIPQTLDMAHHLTLCRQTRGTHQTFLGKLAGGLLFVWKPILNRYLQRTLSLALSKFHLRDEDGKKQEVAKLVHTILQVLARQITTLTIFMSHCFWLSAQITILICLVAVMAGKGEYDFEWKETILSRREQEGLLSLIPTIEDPAKIAYYLSMKAGPEDETPIVPTSVVRISSTDEALLADVDKLSVTAVRSSLAQNAPPWDTQIRMLRDLRSKANQISTRLSMPDAPWPSDIVAAAGTLEDELVGMADSLVLAQTNTNMAEDQLHARHEKFLHQLTELEKRRRELARTIRADAERRSRDDFMEACRKDLGRSLIVLLLLFGVTPRLFVGAMAYLQYRLALRSLRPNLKEDYFRQVLRILEQQHRSGNHDVMETKPVVESPISQPPSQAIASSSATPKTAWGAVDAKRSMSAGISTAAPAADWPRTVCPPTKVFVLSYGVALPKAGWLATLQLDVLPNVSDLGEMESRRRRTAAVDAIREAADSVIGLVVVVDYADAPGDVLRQFLESLLICVPDLVRTSGCVVLLTYGERARRKYNNEESLQQLQSSWNQLADAIAVPRPRFLLFDHEHPTVESRLRLRTEWTDRWLGLQEASALLLPGPHRYRRAWDIIVASSRQAEEARDATAISVLLDAMLGKIDALYTEESKNWYSGLKETFASYKDDAARTFQDTDNLAQAIESAGERAAAVAQQGSQRLITETLAVFRRQPRWQKAAILGTGVLVVGGFAASGLGPLLAAGSAISPTFLGGVCATLGVGTATLIGALGLRRMLPRVSDDTGDSEGVYLCLDDFVCSGIVRTVILELQGRSPTDVACQLESILGRCHVSPVTTSDQAQELCHRIDELLTEGCAVQN